MNIQRKKLFALGRLRSGEMNKTESAYRQYLEDEKIAGRILDYWFESLKVKIANGQCWYLPDFLVQLPSGELQLHEVKGNRAVFADDAKVKVKSCATQYPFKMIVAYPKRKKDGGGWEFEEFE